MAASGVDGFAVGVVVETAWGQSMPYKEVDASSCVHGGNKIIDMTSLICPRYQRLRTTQWLLVLDLQCYRFRADSGSQDSGLRLSMPVLNANGCRLNIRLKVVCIYISIARLCTGNIYDLARTRWSNSDHSDVVKPCPFLDIRRRSTYDPDHQGS
jgi:hypothetical protein